MVSYLYLWYLSNERCSHFMKIVTVTFIMYIICYFLLFIFQDICKSCGSFGKGDEGRMIACTQCGQCYHPFCANIKVMYKCLTEMIMESFIDRYSTYTTFYVWYLEIQCFNVWGFVLLAFTFAPQFYPGCIVILIV